MLVFVRSEVSSQTKLFCTSAFLIAALSLFPRSTSAQLTLSNPGGSNVKIESTSDYATEVLGDPWDMSESSDIANFIPVADTGTGISNVSFSGGSYNFTLAYSDASYFHLLSPGQCSTNPLGKNGQAFPIDTTKYRYLTIRMNTTAESELRVLWYRSCSYATQWVQTVSTATKQGWHTYVIDLATVSHQTSSGGDLAWSATPVTGLRIDAGYAGNVSIDWVRLSATSPGTNDTDIAYSFSAAGSNTRHSVFLDDDSSPFNGYVQALSVDAGSASPVNVSSDYLAPGNYLLNGVASDDFATLRANPWDMDSSGDIGQTGGISSQTFSSGTYSGHASGDAYFYLNLFDSSINPAIYRYLCFRINATQGGLTTAIWFNNSTSPAAGYFTLNAGDNTYSLDLQNITRSGAAWNSALWTKLRLGIPNSGSGNDFSVQWVALRQNGCSSSDSAPTPSVSPGYVVVNSPPHIKILQPDNRGGADFASTVLQDPWNFENTDDIKSYSNLSATEIYPNNYVDGLQGDFFHGESTEGSGDPYDPVLEEASTSSSRIDASRFKNVVYRLNVARTQDVVNGSVVRVIWQAAGDGDTKPFNGDDQITHDGWNEYVQDMTKIALEPSLHPSGSYVDPAWHGNVNYFRIDAHEFTPATGFYFDYIRVTADDEANSKFAITYELDDADDEAADVSVSFYYSTSSTLSNPQAIVSSLPMSRDSRVYLWDTSGLSAGTYYVFAIATDRYNSITRAATGRLVKTSSTQDTTDPAMVIDQPTAGRTVYSSMVVSGYALDDIQTADVEVLIDGELAEVIHPDRLNKLARTSHPTYAEASNAGFFERIDTSGLSNGAHQVEIKAYDTSGNVTSSGTIAITKAAGSDPSPIADPSAENESPITIEAPPAVLAFSAKLDSKKNSAKFSIKNGASCSSIELQGSSKKGDLSKVAASGMVMASSGGKAAVALTATKIQGLKRAKVAIPVYFAATCNGQRTSKVIKLLPTSLSNSKKAKTADKWLTALKPKIK